MTKYWLGYCFLFFSPIHLYSSAKTNTSRMWINKDNIKVNHIVPQLNWAITLVVIVIVIISHQHGG